MTQASQASHRAGYDVAALRRDFPILSQQVHGKPLVYLDNAATTQKPQAVLDALHDYYAVDNANIHRAVHTLAERATRAYEAARLRVAAFLGAPDPRGVVFTRGTTESINLVAQTFGRSIHEGQSIVLSQMEHHSNIVPWQLVAQQTGAEIRVVPVLDDGSLDMKSYEGMLDDDVGIVAMVHVSNSLGTVNPVHAITRLAHMHGAKVLLDGAQAAPHVPIDVADIGCDFYAMSGHKVYGPTGIGALWARPELLDEMPPYQGGGEMIRSVRFEGTTYNDIPHKFEAGTPNIAGAIGLHAALDYVDAIGIPQIAAHEQRLLEYATRRIGEVEGVRIIGTTAGKAAVLSFDMAGIHPHDVGSLLDREGVAIRTGNHCTQPLVERFGLPATDRASFGLYNTLEEVDVLIDALQKIRGYFS